ncbi:hypothetical protein RGR602_PB00484 (plasmid) [Rhizobium gallicum bv. gallicum R602sp]|uniref:Uncharacterized protein n=1 Tax=Rhizobium gallicum bv. gallicum R602sp TaxID=1041138 RepID=A0A0B4XBN7_9HYPH|nr:hypothetical protein RGR602_PB00484 [Rhizobium gallicum bv. gallicum R602sp]
MPKAARLAPSRPSISSTRSSRRRRGGAPANRPFLSIPILLILDELGNLPVQRIRWRIALPSPSPFIRKSSMVPKT